MSFSDLNFLFRFIPLFLIAYYLTPTAYRMWILFAGSFVFYSLGEPKLFLVLLIASLANYYLARASKAHEKKLFISIVTLDVSMLAVFKLLSLTVDSTLLPVGISFFTFKMISYQADLYMGRLGNVMSLRDTLAYFYMFPQVLQGPIMRAEDMKSLAAMPLGELETRQERFEKYLKNIEDGLKYFIAGLGMKVLLADHLAICWRDIAAIGYESISTPLAWLGAVVYSLELYFDFWGYSLMAAGLGVAMGFRFIENFSHPYAATGVGDFYRRWHVTLGTWFRDYIYIPLGGSRCSKLKTIRNLFVVWLITGLWHGVTLNFVIWGLSLFLIIIWEKFVLSGNRLLGKILGRFHVLVLIPLTWVIFAISDIDLLRTYFARLFPFFGVGIAINHNDIFKYLEMYGLLIVIGVILLIPKVFDFMESKRRHPFAVVVLFVLFWACIYSLSNAAGNPFMYFRF